MARRNGIYSIITGDGDLISKRRYTYMYEASPNRFLVRVDKKYGIIDLKDDIIVPIKYKKFEKIGEDLFLTKLNGYWGMINSSNKTIVKNEYENEEFCNLISLFFLDYPFIFYNILYIIKIMRHFYIR